MHPIRYAEQFWLKQRFAVVFLVGLGVAMTGYTWYVTHRIESAGIWLAYIPAGLLLYAGIRYYRYKLHARVEEDGVVISKLGKSVRLGYDQIRSVRVQPLRHHFPESRKRLINPMTRPLLDEPALYLKLTGDPEELARVAKALGPRFFADGTAVFPVNDPESLAGEISPRLPQKQAANLGGGRRQKRRR